MPNSTNRLFADNSKLILDTSVIINLHESGLGEQIVRAIMNKILVTEEVEAEMNHFKSYETGSHGFLKDLLKYGLVSKVKLNGREDDLLIELTTKLKRSDRIQGNSKLMSIDEGEASVIAVAKFRNYKRCIPIIDDRQGTKIAEKLLNGRYVGYSIDIFLHPMIITELGASLSAESLFRALRYGGMRVLACHYEQVIEMIGNDNARKCDTLTKLNRMFGNV